MGWVESFPSDNQTSETIVRLLVDHVICCHGVSEALISDRGPNLLSTLMQEVCETTGMQKLNTTAYHPQADGLVENFNRTLRTMLAKYAAKIGIIGMNISITCYLHIELNPINPLVSLRFSCYMGMMLGFPVRAHYPRLAQFIKWISMTTSPSWYMDFLKPGNWPEVRCRNHKRSRSTNMIAVLNREISKLVTG